MCKIALACMFVLFVVVVVVVAAAIAVVRVVVVSAELDRSLTPPPEVKPL